ncbi:MAG: hypothetical protein KF726_00610 [Anaerolineae bacterium]|nr:hypothetical protein [Anaerolineae bacterium]
MFLRRTGCIALAAIAIVLASACLISALVFTGIMNERRAVAQEALSPRIVYGLTFMPSGFDPHINQNSELGIVFRSVYDTLLYRDPNTKQLIPGLAEHVDISADGLTYTFKLKSGVKFHDGEPFDANAVAVTLDRIVNPDTASQKSLALLGSYSRYEIVDALTIKVILNSPYSPLLDGFSQVYLGIASPKALNEYDNATYQFHQVGTGPFMLVDYVPGERIILRRNPDYAWGPSFYEAPTADSVKEIEFRFFQDPATRAPALETGEAQVMGELAPADALLFSRGTDVQVLPQPIPGQPLQFFINTSAAPTSDLAVRRALIFATDRAAIVDSIFQQFSPIANGPLSATTVFYDTGLNNLYRYDQASARELLAQAGYSDSDGDGILDKPDATGIKPLRLVVITPPFGLVPQVVQKLQSQWRGVGIDVEIRQVPNLAAIMEQVDSGDYHLVAFSDYGVDASILNRYYRSDGIMNLSKWKNTEMDAWLDRATATVDETERSNLYIQIQRHIMENALILPIRDYVNLNAASANIQDLKFDAYGWFPILANVKVVNANS